MSGCKACTHTQREQIDRDLLANIGSRTICAYSGLSLGGLSRHRRHLKQSLGLVLADRSEGERAEHGSRLLLRVEKITNRLASLIYTHEGDLRALVPAIRTMLDALRFVGDLTGELPKSGSGINVTLNANRSITNNVTYETNTCEKSACL